MCVIIITNPENPINKNELQRAWNTNPDGAGYAYTDGETVHFKRGFMNFKKFNKEVQDLQQHYNLMLHLRISTGGGIEPINTHPYKVGNMLKMNGETTAPVVSMNGIIYGETLKTKRGHLMNDTASYIMRYENAFKVINTDILNIISEETGAKWAAVTTNGIIYSKQFKQYNGRQYSNLNHIDILDRTPTIAETWDGIKPEHLIKDPELLESIYKDWDLCDELEEFIYYNCNLNNCRQCRQCISEATNKKQVRHIIETNTYYNFYRELIE